MNVKAAHKLEPFDRVQLPKQLGWCTVFAVDPIDDQEVKVSALDTMERHVTVVVHPRHPCPVRR